MITAAEPRAMLFRWTYASVWMATAVVEPLTLLQIINKSFESFSISLHFTCKFLDIKCTYPIKKKLKESVKLANRGEDTNLLSHL